MSNAKQTQELKSVAGFQQKQNQSPWQCRCQQNPNQSPWQCSMWHYAKHASRPGENNKKPWRGARKQLAYVVAKKWWKDGMMLHAMGAKTTWPFALPDWCCYFCCFCSFLLIVVVLYPPFAVAVVLVTALICCHFVAMKWCCLCCHCCCCCWLIVSFFKPFGYNVTADRTIANTAFTASVHATCYCFLALLQVTAAVFVTTTCCCYFVAGHQLTVAFVAAMVDCCLCCFVATMVDCCLCCHHSWLLPLLSPWLIVAFVATMVDCCLYHHCLLVLFCCLPPVDCCLVAAVASCCLCCCHGWLLPLLLPWLIVAFVAIAIDCCICCHCGCCQHSALLFAMHLCSAHCKFSIFPCCLSLLLLLLIVCSCHVWLIMANVPCDGNEMKSGSL